jgi:His-Xaa-Ser system radical SAM maturase HxsC
MLLKVTGKAYNINEPIVGIITRNIALNGNNYILISENEIPNTNTENFKAILTKSILSKMSLSLPIVYSVITFDHLSEGDIVLINSSGMINTLYRLKSFQNFLLVTERCNSNCLMCSQPPKDIDDIPYRFNIHERLIPLIPKNCFELGITGGEPTLMGDLFFKLLSLIKRELPDTEIHCLTNGRVFVGMDYAKKLGSLDYKRLMLGIPLYSDYYLQHDYIVQAKNAWNQTMEGLYNLAFHNIRIEIRVVLHRLTIPRLTKLTKFIYKNLPFVEHVALMGLEFQGYTPYNINKLWIDPIEYMNELQEAAEFLSNMGINVSIYNCQLCLMPKELWKYNRKSISDWKNIYLEECTNCSINNECGGFFKSNKNMHSKFIKRINIPIQTVQNHY